MSELVPQLEDFELDQVPSYFQAIHRYTQLLATIDHKEENLHGLRHKAWLRTALATVLQTTKTEAICQFWSSAADQVLQKAWELASCNEQPISLFTLGKLGANELNLSSDIDILIIGDSRSTEAYSCYRKFHKLITEATDLGFCFRLDNDLRPGGRLGPFITSIEQFQDYYWRQSSTWEKLALVRLRFIAGNEDLSKEILELRDKFIYRKYLDFSLLTEFKSLRAKIAKLPNITSQNIKLSPGGIRDIELFVHSLQVIHGGQNDNLKTSSTSLAIQELSKSNFITKEQEELLLSNYWFFREAENIVQATNDQQTHDWPEEEIPLNFATDFSSSFEKRKALIDETVSHLLGPSFDHKNSLPPTEKEQQDWLKELGFSDEVINEVWPKLINMNAQSATRTQKDEEARKEFLYRFIVSLSKSQLDINLGLHLLLSFIESSRAKSTLYSLLLHDEKIIDDLSSLFSCSPYLGGVIASRPELIDNFILRTQDINIKDNEEFYEKLLEKKLLSEVFAANNIIRSQSLEDTPFQLTKTADTICQSLLERIKDDFKTSTLDILCLGKWGGKELGVKSDLDFVFVTSMPPTEADQKVAKRFLSRLQDQHRGGRLYSFDLRLRPSGNAGPMLIHIDNLTDYLSSKAEPWEKQSYLKARLLSGHAEKISDNYIQQGLSKENLEELKKIKAKLLTANDKSTINLKLCPGGLIDIELATQTYFLVNKISAPENTLEQLDFILEHDKGWRKEGMALKTNYSRLRLIEQLQQIFTSHQGSQLKPESESFSRLAKYFGKGSKAFGEELHQLLEQNTESLKNLDPII